MKVATIVPQKCLYLTQDDDFFMCLGNFINEPGYEEYTAFFQNRSADGNFVVMDNGLIEGDQRPITELVQKAHMIGAKEMILTDKFMDKEGTLKSIAKDIEALKGISHPQLMLVPQGKTVSEWVDCAHELIKRYSPMPFTIGVPKVLTKLGGRDARINAIKELLERSPLVRHKQFHLLGCWSTPLELTMIDKLVRQGVLPKIRSCDSAIAYVYTRSGQKIDHGDRPDSLPIDFKKGRECNMHLLKYNIRKWKQAANSDASLLTRIELWAREVMYELFDV